MPAVQNKTNMTAEQLLQEVKKLPPSELEKFMAKVNRLSSKLKTPKVSRIEIELLKRIDEGTPKDLLERSKKLNNKRRRGTLTKAEHKELIEITEELERLNVIRIESLIKLSQIRKKPLEVLMDELGIKSPGYV